MAFSTYILRAELEQNDVLNDGLVNGLLNQEKTCSVKKQHNTDRIDHSSSLLQPLEPRVLLSGSASYVSIEAYEAGHTLLLGPSPTPEYYAYVSQEQQIPTANAESESLTRHVENLDRGVVAIRQSSSQVYIGWRLLGLDAKGVSFNVYRQTGNGAALKINASPLTSTTDFVDNSADLTQENQYFVRTIQNGIEGEDSARFTLEANAAAQPYLSVPLQIPADGVAPSGETYSYTANDASVGDVDGDGQYEIILKWDPSNAKDSGQSGYTGNVYIDAYKMDGTQLWRIDLGQNIRAGAHYTQFVVYDLDSDGRAEVAMQTAPGTIDGLGDYVLMGDDDPSANYRNSDGRILSGPEYYTVFDGYTGEALSTVALEPERGDIRDWGDNYGNRVDRFTTGVAYLDGQDPSVILGRGYYHGRSGFESKNEIAAYDFRDGQLSVRWIFEAATNGPNAEYVGQGAHSLTVGDVDGDGYDEVVYGAAVIDHDGTGLYSTGLGHGDALHLSDMDPTNPGLEIFMVHESYGSYTSQGVNAGAALRDAATGEILVAIPATNDVGRGVAMDIDPNALGYEMWATTSDPDGGSRQIYNVSGDALYGTPGNMHYNFGVWWDSDLLRETLDGTTISKWDYERETPGRSNYISAWQNGAASNNGTKSTPALSGDILGDWREEVIWRSSDSSELQIWTTTIRATNRLYTLMHDTQYRVSIAAQNSAYNQPPHTSFYLGAGMQDPPIPQVSYAVFDGDLPIVEKAEAYQAEDANYDGPGVVVENEHTGHFGSGYVNFGRTGDVLEFNNVNGGYGGEVTIRFRYALGNSPRTGVLFVNGIEQSITFNSTSSWSTWAEMELTVALQPGVVNTIQLQSTGQDLANIDQLEVLPSVQPPAEVASLMVNDGQAQRSHITHATIEFTQAVTLNSDSVVLTQSDGSVLDKPVDFELFDLFGNGKTWQIQFKGDGTRHGSLVDGYYRLTVLPAEVESANGLAVLGEDPVLDFHRYYGDYDGNTTVNNADFYWFRNAFLIPSDASGYLRLFDYEGNGIVNNADFFQFRSRFAKPLSV